MEMTVKQTAFCTVTALGLATAGSVVAAVTTASAVAAVAYGVLSVGLAGVSLGAIKAAFDTNSVDIESYFSNTRDAAGYAAAGLFQFAAQTFVQALIQGAAHGIGQRVQRSIGGPDVTVGRV